MPEFKLEQFKRPKERSAVHMIYTQNEYCNKVNMPGWDEQLESLPKDYDAFNPPGGNQFISTHKRLGYQPEVDHWLTTTKAALEQIKLKDTLNRKNENLPIVHFMNFKQPPSPPTKPSKCSADNTPNYRTTMQTSYRMPYPYVIQRLSVPIPPFLQNRKLKADDPDFEPSTFYDDSIIENTKMFQNIKGKRTVSYDPIAQRYSDGTELPTLSRKCVELPFRHV